MMDIEKLIEQLRIACAGNPHNIMGVAANVLSTLQTENEEMQKQLNEFSEFLCYMTGGLLSKTNYTAQEMISAAEDYQQKVCGECYLRAENKKLRAELERVKAERDAAILFAQCYTEKVDNSCTVCRHRFNEIGAPLKKRCENCGLTGTPECGWEFDFNWDLKDD